MRANRPESANTYQQVVDAATISRYLESMEKDNRMANLSTDEIRRRECYPELLRLVSRVAQAVEAVAKRNSPEDRARRTLVAPGQQADSP